MMMNWQHLGLSDLSERFKAKIVMGFYFPVQEYCKVEDFDGILAALEEKKECEEYHTRLENEFLIKEAKKQRLLKEREEELLKEHEEQMRRLSLKHQEEKFRYTKEYEEELVKEVNKVREEEARKRRVRDEEGA